MKTVIIDKAFSVDAPTETKYAVGDEPTVADATADDWVAKGLAHHKPGPKPADAKPSPKSAA
jgi:hypothetical protein